MNHLDKKKVLEI